MKRYYFDMRINTQIQVIAMDLEKANERAKKIIERLELIDHERDQTLSMDMEDGLELMSEEVIVSSTNLFSKDRWKILVTQNSTELGYQEWRYAQFLELEKM